MVNMTSYPLYNNIMYCKGPKPHVKFLCELPEIYKFSIASKILSVMIEVHIYFKSANCVS